MGRPSPRLSFPCRGPLFPRRKGEGRPKSNSNVPLPAAFTSAFSVTRTPVNPFPLPQNTSLSSKPDIHKRTPTTSTIKHKNIELKKI